MRRRTELCKVQWVCFGHGSDGDCGFIRNMVCRFLMSITNRSMLSVEGCRDCIGFRTRHNAKINKNGLIYKVRKVKTACTVYRSLNTDFDVKNAAKSMHTLSHKCATYPMPRHISILLLILPLVFHQPGLCLQNSELQVHDERPKKCQTPCDLSAEIWRIVPALGGGSLYFMV